MYRKYPMNEQFFKTWSLDMAYILGFSISDGNMNKYRLNYLIAEKDRCVLEYIRDVISPSSPIQQTSSYRKGTLCKGVVLGFSSQYMSETLVKLSIFPRKTGKEFLPKCPKKYRHALLRGIFDGDGCVGEYKNRLRFKITSASKKFLEDVKRDLGFNYGYVNQTKNYYIWNVYKQDHIKHIAKYMYQDDGFCLSRKKDRFKL